MRSLTKHRGVDTDKLQAEYVEFMTSPGAHNDSYASTCHRMSFQKRATGLPLKECPDNDGHNVDTIDALVATVPAILATFDSADRKAAVAGANAVVAATRRPSQLRPYVDAYTRLLRSTLRARASPRPP